jgi:hypothetical protein
MDSSLAQAGHVEATSIAVVSPYRLSGALLPPTTCMIQYAQSLGLSGATVWLLVLHDWPRPRRVSVPLSGDSNLFSVESQLLSQ